MMRPPRRRSAPARSCASCDRAAASAQRRAPPTPSCPARPSPASPPRTACRPQRWPPPTASPEQRFVDRRDDAAGPGVRAPRPQRATPAPAAAAGRACEHAAAGGHLVTPGETLSGIAAATASSTSALAAANGLVRPAFVIAGTRCGSRVGGQRPRPAAVERSAPVARGQRRAPRGARRDAVRDRRRQRPLDQPRSPAPTASRRPAFVIAGTRLRIPAASRRRAAAPPAGDRRAAARWAATSIRPGDTLSALAARSGVPRRADGRDERPASPTRLLIGAAAEAADGLARSWPRAPAAAPRRSQPRWRPAAPRTRSRAAQRRRRSPRSPPSHGVPGSLAAAIAWQESGFNNAMVSSANARGVMQVMPGTWAWVQRNLASARSTRTRPTDNVHAGSLYLGQLLRDDRRRPGARRGRLLPGPVVGAARRDVPRDAALREQRPRARGRFGG